GTRQPVILFVNGAEGDVSPSHEGFAQPEDLGESFAEQATAHLSSAKSLSSAWSVKKTKVELGPPSVGNCAGSQFLNGLSQLADPLLWTAFPTHTNVWSIKWGDVQMMTWPGEATTYLGDV